MKIKDYVATLIVCSALYFVALHLSSVWATILGILIGCFVTSLVGLDIAGRMLGQIYKDLNEPRA